MPLIQLLEVLIVVGVLLWLVDRFIPMQASIKSILNGVVVIAVVLWLLNVFGLFHSISRLPVGTWRMSAATPFGRWGSFPVANARSSVPVAFGRSNATGLFVGSWHRVPKIPNLQALIPGCAG